MSRSKSWAAIRERTAVAWGARCWWCKVPTAATIEHLKTRTLVMDKLESSGGGHRSDNLRLACPWCNSKRGNEPVESWEGRQGWLMPARGGLPDNVDELVRRDYGGSTTSGYVPTRNTNSRLLITQSPNKKGETERAVHCEIRAGKGYDWRRVRLGRVDNPRVVAAADEFMRRHFAKPGEGRPKPMTGKRRRKPRQ